MNSANTNNSYPNAGYQPILTNIPNNSNQPVKKSHNPYTIYKVVISILILFLAILVGLLFYIQYKNNTDLENINNRNIELSKEIEKQKSLRENNKNAYNSQQNTIKNIISTQKNLLEEIANYTLLIDESIEINGGQEKVLPQTDLKNFNAVRTQLDLEIESLNDEMITYDEKSKTNDAVVQ
jgi:hypothetical protein